MFISKYQVRISDINYGGHMGNERSLVAFQQARIEWLETLGLSELNIGENRGLIQRRANVEYLREISLGDILNVKIYPVEIRGSYFILAHEVNNQNGVTVLTGNVTLGAFDYTNKKLAKIPIKLKKILEAEKTTEG
ncbi:thioesterase family protein [uncultured Ilyobacter sp.]|uniref:acyl-CoA thioesterase n=1 Tax=uncultured Ilyobacter sp. TaxID=544433 RepID=UPI0029C98949|nr:thioesterase family protein [uncultured Ilyobacter sp.]